MSLRLLKMVKTVLTSPLLRSNSRFKSKMGLSHEEAVRTLNSLQSNAETIEKIRAAGDAWKGRNLQNMEKYIQRSGLTLEEIDNLSVIHISGTKGKGSTAAFCESILRHQGFKTGFFSSPHLVEVRERIRINGKPIGKDLFSSKFWDVFNKLSETKEEHDGLMPPYFAFLTVLSCHIFLEEKVDVAIIEVGIGGEYDSTNFIRHPAVCGITSLGLDHVSLLGNTIESIAWNKAGIFKPGVPAVTIEQQAEAMRVIHERSIERKMQVYVTEPLSEEEKITLGINGHKQRLNAALALQLSKLWRISSGNHNNSALTKELPTKGNICDIPILPLDQLTKEHKEGLSQCKWYGRNQTVHRPGITYYLDGAHTIESMEQCVEWFKTLSQSEEKQIAGKVNRILVFNITGDRDVLPMFDMLKSCNFDAAVFTPNVTFSAANQLHADNMNYTVSDEAKQRRCWSNKEIWDKLHHTTKEVNDCDLNKGFNNGSSIISPSAETSKTKSLVSHCLPCISSALFWATQGKDSLITLDSNSEIPEIPASFKHAPHIQVLITGSLHLVGGALTLIMPNLNDS